MKDLQWNEVPFNFSIELNFVFTSCSWSMKYKLGKFLRMKFYICLLETEKDVSNFQFFRILVMAHQIQILRLHGRQCKSVSSKLCEVHYALAIKFSSSFLFGNELWNLMNGLKVPVQFSVKWSIITPFR